MKSTETNRTNLDLLFGDGEDGFLIHDEFYNCCEFRGPISQGDASKFVLWVQKLMQDKSDKPAYILLNCLGGDVNAVLTIHHHITVLRQFKTVKTWNMNEAYSGAALILASGTLGERYASRHSHTMIHGVQVAMSNHAPIHNWQNDMKQMQKLNDQFIWAVTKETLRGKYAEDLDENDPEDIGWLHECYKKNKLKAERDIYLCAKDAVAEGFVDEVCSVVLPLKPKEELMKEAYGEEGEIPSCHTFIQQQIVVTDPSQVSFEEEEDEDEE